jgi:hypothetical protein
MGTTMKYEFSTKDGGFENWIGAWNVFKDIHDLMYFIHEMHWAERDGEYKFRNIRIE